MTVSLEEQLRSLAAASLEPPSEVEPSDVNRPPRSTRTLWVACAAAMVAVVLVGGVLVSRVDRSDPTASPPPVDVESERPPASSTWAPSTRDLIGLDAPAVRGTALDGSVVDLDAYRGRWVVIHLFASWCEPCRRDLADLTEAARSRPDVQFLTLIFDDTGDAAVSVLTEAGVDWPVLDTAGGPAQQALLDYRITGIPETIVVSPDGTVSDVHQGAITSELLESSD